mgnify:FL=1|tara:strand:+ start:931 stop:1143 length:213 start_codon:yes stop_codon:yes gene_type:complete
MRQQNDEIKVLKNQIHSLKSELIRMNSRFNDVDNKLHEIKTILIDMKDNPKTPLISGDAHLADHTDRWNK